MKIMPPQEKRIITCHPHSLLSFQKSNVGTKKKENFMQNNFKDYSLKNPKRNFRYYLRVDKFLKRKKNLFFGTRKDFFGAPTQRQAFFHILHCYMHDGL